MGTSSEDQFDATSAMPGLDLRQNPFPNHFTDPEWANIAQQYNDMQQSGYLSRSSSYPYPFLSWRPLPDRPALFFDQNGTPSPSPFSTLLSSNSAEDSPATPSRPPFDGVGDGPGLIGHPDGVGLEDSLDGAGIRKLIDQACQLSDSINKRYNDVKNRSPQSAETIDSDREALSVLQRQLSAIVSSNQLPELPAGTPPYGAQAHSAALYLYTAAANAGLAGPDHIPAAIIEGIMKGMTPSRPRR